MMIFLYADVETTGLDPEYSSIFQIAGIFKRKDMHPKSFNYKFKPYKGALTIAPQLAKKIKVTSEDLISYPDQRQFFDQFIADLNVFTDNMTNKIYLVGYNASFDMDFIRSWFLYNGNTDFSKYFYFPCIDVMYLSAFALIGERQNLFNFQLSTVYKYLTGKSLEGAHDAFTDINATVEILNIVTNKLRGKE